MDTYLCGAGGLGREVLDECTFSNIPVTGFFDDVKPKGTLVNSVPVVGCIKDIKEICEYGQILFSVGSPRLKMNWVRESDHPLFGRLISKHARVGSQTHVGVNVVICAGTKVNCNIIIGHHVFINVNVTVGHDVLIDNFVNISPGVIVCGGVKIGLGCDLGAGSVILPKVELPEFGIIGAGTIVTKTPEVPPGHNYTMVGNPGRVIKTSYEEHKEGY